MAAATRLAIALALCAAGAGWASAVAGPRPTAARELRPPLAGKTLAEALQTLQAEGLPIVFSSALVLPSMTVATEPRPGPASALLADLLRPHGLAAAQGPGERWIVVRAEPATTATTPDEAEPDPLDLPTARERIEVTTPLGESRHGEPVAATLLVLSPHRREGPHFGGDVFRATGLLPGAATRESSSRVSVRGAREDDTLILLDGLELLAPFHLQEFDAGLGIVSAASLGRVELMADPPPVEYGDRLGGVLDMTSRTPVSPFALSLGLGSLFAEASAAGLFGDGRGQWLGSLRGGNYRLALEANGRRADPRYWDLFGKLGYHLRPDQQLELRLLLAADKFRVAGDLVGGGKYRSRWESSYLWLTHQASLGGSALAESMAWAGRLERIRVGKDAVQGGARFELDDSRTLEFVGVKTVWRLAPQGAPWTVDGGVEARQLQSRIDYLAERRGGPAALPGSSANGGDVDYASDLEFEQLGVFASSRWHPTESFRIEAGLRYDRSGQTEESHLSPRLHLAWRPADQGVLRAAWGRFHQSQRPYELQVEDGETTLSPAEHEEQRLLSYEHQLARGASWRVGAFHRRSSHQRVRYESLFDTAVLYPELAPGRIRLEPAAGRALGFELSFQSRAGARGNWSAAYSRATVADRLGDRWVPRATDEPHSFRLEGHVALDRGWAVSGSWLYHTGWPTTAVGARLATGTDGAPAAELELGPVRGERLRDYHRLDLRVGREWQLQSSRLGAFVEIQNAYDRRNPRGFESFDLRIGRDGRALVEPQPVDWGGILPTVGARWSF